MLTSSIRTRLRRKNALAAAIIVAGGFAAPDLHAATWTVNSCSDSITGSLPTKTGTLRFAAQNAGTGDIIDLSQLPGTYSCSTISLQTGAIILGQSSITLQGSPAAPVTITGKYCTSFPTCTKEPDRIFYHTGTGTLDIYGLTLTKGYLTSSGSTNVIGGCIYSKGNVILDHSDVTFCGLKAGSAVAEGGGIFADGTVSLISSAVTYNYANSASGAAFGGGILSIGTADVRYSTIQGNQASSTSGGTGIGYGGGLMVEGSLYLLGSTVATNSVNRNFAGVYVTQGSPATKAVVVRNSTISGNSAGNVNGGLFTNAHSVRFDNSTIAFNTSTVDRFGSFPNFLYYAPGVSLVATASNVSVTLQSTLMANNTTGSDEYDLSAVADPQTVTFSGSNNIVRATFVSAPAGTFTKIVCPLLGPLRDNGGGVPTHALLSRSPGIDQGNNLLGLIHDERGSPYARVSGASADIGAYEVQQADILFNTSFETCPALF